MPGAFVEIGLPGMMDIVLPVGVCWCGVSVVWTLCLSTVYRKRVVLARCVFVLLPSTFPTYCVGGDTLKSLISKRIGEIGLSKSEVSRRMGVSRTTLYRWMSDDGIAGATLASVEKLSKVLGCRPSSLFEMDGDAIPERN